MEQNTAITSPIFIGFSPNKVQNNRTETWKPSILVASLIDQLIIFENRKNVLANSPPGGTIGSDTVDSMLANHVTTRSLDLTMQGAYSLTCIWFIK